jgi:hypothetical protein
MDLLRCEDVSLCHKSNCRELIYSCRSFHRLAVHFPTSLCVQLKISWKEIRHICRRWGAGQPLLWRSLAWELYVEKSSLIPTGPSSATQVALSSGSCCASADMSDSRTAPAFLNGHRPVPRCSQLPLYKQQHNRLRAPFQTARFLEAIPRKKVFGHSEFSKKFGIMAKHHLSNDATRMHGF